MEKPLGRSLHDMKIDARIFLGHLPDNGGNDPDLRDGRSRTDMYFSCCRVLDGLDFPDPLPEFIEDCDASNDTQIRNTSGFANNLWVQMAVLFIAVGGLIALAAKYIW